FLSQLIEKQFEREKLSADLDYLSSWHSSDRPFIFLDRTEKSLRSPFYRDNLPAKMYQREMARKRRSHGKKEATTNNKRSFEKAKETRQNKKSDNQKAEESSPVEDAIVCPLLQTVEQVKTF